MDFGFRIGDFGRWILDWGFRISECNKLTINILHSEIQNPQSEIHLPKSETLIPKSEIHIPKSEIPNPKSVCFGQKLKK
jgi:hypothetical protein